MAFYVVTYDLVKQGQNYEGIIGELKAYPVHWHAQQSVWFVETSESAVQVRDKLAAHLDQNDKLIVARLNGEAAWRGYAENVNTWLKDRLKAP